MYSNKIYIVAITKNLRDVDVERVYDGNIFTLNTILHGYEKKLKDIKYQVSIIGDNAYIDIIENKELIKTISILSKQVLLEKD